MAIALTSAKEIQFNPSVETLIKDCVQSDNCKLASNGAVVAYSGKYTGRTPKDKFIVATGDTIPNIWWGNNARMEPSVYAGLQRKVADLLPQKKVYVIDTFAGADPNYQIKVRFVLERPYHALFIKQLLIRPSAEELKDFVPDWTVFDFGKDKTNPEADGVRSEATIALDFSQSQAIIFGTEYAGEIKKSIFTVMNYILPLQDVMGMHCSANIGAKGDTALFFGLSGTGKTTLSADPDRYLIGDDEHGWSDQGVFNVEGGCYAKCIHLSREGEPEIWDAIRHGSVLENVILNADGTPDYEDGSLTENTRCAYPIDYIEKRVNPSVGGHPKNIFLLTCDALGVLPPISKLTPEEATDMFLIGYTAKLAGTEVGVTDPSLTFSTCFGAPFMPLRPQVYADLLRKKIQQRNANVWLVNTGWSGGGFGVGSRMKLSITRRLLSEVLNGDLQNCTYEPAPVFGYQIPTACPEVPSEILSPRNTWADKAAYDEKANYLKGEFKKQLADLLARS